MNILFCGDKNVIDGLIIAILSLMKNTNRTLNIYVLTMHYQTKDKVFSPMSKQYISSLNKLVKKKNKNSFVKLIDITDKVMACIPEANVDTRFTPYCMLRLYADEIDELPDKLLYLDTDVVCLNNPDSFYDIDNTKYELVGVLDYYGSHFFKRKMYQKDYLNSGVLLINLKLIKETKLFEKTREYCKNKKLLMPDQTALNVFATSKLIVNRKYNEQNKIHDDTVFRHFTTTFKFWPTVHTQTIKPWHIDDLHNKLNCHEFDDILEEYINCKKEIK